MAGSADFLTLLESRGVLVRGVKRPVRYCRMKKIGPDEPRGTFAARTTLVESMLALDNPRVSRYLLYTYDLSCLGPSARVRAADRPRRVDAVGLLQSSRPGVGERLLRR